MVRAPEPSEVSALASVLSKSFSFSPEDAAAWIAAAGRENARVTDDPNGGIAAGLLTLPMGQFWGGRRVAMAGIAAVAVLPECRGDKQATRLMSGTLRDLYRGGMALSTLFPTTLGLYKSVGYGVAGLRWDVRVDLGRLPRGDRSLPLRRASVDDVMGIRAAHLTRARYSPGALDRHPFLWDRVLARKGVDTEGFVVGDEQVEGYVFLLREPGKGGHADLNVTDVAALTPRAADRILAFFADYSTIAHRAGWLGSPGDALLARIPDRHWSITKDSELMLRIVDLQAAMEARGWPAGFHGELEIELTDNVIPENEGRFILQWADGQARVRRGGTGRLQMDIGAFASLYTGYRSPSEHVAAGEMSADDRSQQIAATAFAATPPVSWDRF